MNLKFYRYFLLGFLLIWLIHSYAVQYKWIPYKKDASNYFSSLARAQAGISSDAPIALLGTSIAGRIPGVESGNPTIANYGADGSTFYEGLKWLEWKEKAYQMIIIETNLMHGLPKEKLIDHVSLWQRVGTRHPEVAAYARPSAQLYSLARASRGFSSLNKEKVILSPVKSVMQTVDYEDSERFMEQHEKLLHILMRWKNSGSKIVFVEFPSGNRSKNSFSERKPMIMWLCQKLNATFYDFSSSAHHKPIALSDGVHLDERSSHIFANTIQHIFIEHASHE